MSADHRKYPKRFPLGGLAAVAASAALIAGCGGSGASTSSPAKQASTAQPAAVTSSGHATQRGHATPQQSSPDVGAASSQTGKRTSSGTTHKPASGKHAAKSSHKSATPRVQHGAVTPSSSDDTQPVATPASNPCHLVSLTEAQGITQGLVHGRVEAPLGPTCVYKLGGSKRLGSLRTITLTVESLSLAQVTKQMQQRKIVSVAGHQAYCGTLGVQMLFVPVSGGKLLNVTAPCSVAQRFAAVAIGRLSA